jgi:hypothetical protein
MFSFYSNDENHLKCIFPSILCVMCQSKYPTSISGCSIIRTSSDTLQPDNIQLADQKIPCACDSGKNNRHELDRVLYCFDRYTFIITKSYCYNKTNRTEERKERESRSTSIRIPIPVPLPFSQRSMNFFGGFEMLHCKGDVSDINLSVHY